MKKVRNLFVFRLPCFLLYPILLLLVFLSCDQNQVSAATKSFHHTIFISKNMPDTSQKFELDNFAVCYNKYPLAALYAPANANLKSDTLVQTLSLVSPYLKFSSDKRDFIELWWRVFIDSSMANKLVGIEFNDADYTLIFWDENLLVKQGDTAKLSIEKSNTDDLPNIYPLHTGNKGWHDLVIRQKFNNFITNNNILSLYSFSILRNYTSYLEEYTTEEFSFKNVFLEEGFRFFLLCLFIVSVLFYLLVQKTKSFFWFSVFSLCILLFSFQDMFDVKEDFFSLRLIFGLMYLLLFSFLAFVFYTFSGKIPKRIYAYFVLFTVSMSLILFFAINQLAIKYSVYISIAATLMGLLFLILFIEIIVKIIYAIRTKEKRVKIIAFGLLQPFILLPLAFILGKNYTAYLITLSVYLLPVSFLIALILIIKDSFTENTRKQAEVLALTQANEKILAEQNVLLERQVKERTLDLQKEKEIVEDKNRQILDSIEYALRIQNALLPTQKVVKQYLENSFILYKPKDIVAGDFYWMETVQLVDEPISQLAIENNQLILFAACDCTGHGVPGAMVSVVCFNALNRAVREFGLSQPSLILDKTTEIVSDYFSKSEEDIQDGMDISLCALNTKTNELQWAGANNPLWLVRKMDQSSAALNSTQQILISGSNYLIEIKGDKQAIGINENHYPFTNHKFILERGDKIYLFSDGYADQFGGETGEVKLSRKRFKEKLLSIQALNMQEQGNELNNYLIHYQNGVPQIDDILVIGVRV